MGIVFHMKTAAPFSCPYFFTVAGSSAVSKKTDMMLACHKHTDENSGRIFIGYRQADFHHIFHEPERFIWFFSSNEPHVSNDTRINVCRGRLLITYE